MSQNDPEFFTRLRNHMRWTFLAIAVIMAVVFVVTAIR